MLPEDFVKRMKIDLGADADAFFACYNEKPLHALRVNTLKCSADELRALFPNFYERVPWCADGYYYDGGAGAEFSHRAGLFYSQEPSAMCAAEMFDIKGGEKILDLCAAPGGKSTQLAARLSNAGLVVSNEINPSRARILNENIVRLGIKNAIVTQMEPQRLAKLLPNFFDKVIVDAPCSGEGMFRRDSVAIDEWSIAHSESCALRQRLILESAEKMLAPGGELVYSTCTFAKCENEDTVAAFLAAHGDFELVKTHRIMPHTDRGEGHFAALLKKRGKSEIQSGGKFKKPNLALWREFEKDALNITLDGDFIEFGERLFLLPEGSPGLSGIKCLSAGLYLGDAKKGRFEPSHHLATALEKGDFKRAVTLDCESLSRYFKGEELTLDLPNGWCAACFDRFPVGWVKISGRAAKNHYPKNLRG